MARLLASRDEGAGLERLCQAQGDTAELLEPADAAFNGLITNDKFCLLRSVRLVLNWRRRVLRLRNGTRGRGGTVLDLDGDRGGCR